MSLVTGLAILAALLLFGVLVYFLVIRPAPESGEETLEEANARLMDLREDFQRSKEG